MLLDTLMIVFRRCFRREPSSNLHPITEQSKRFWYRKGVEAGRKQQAPPVYGPYCERHETHLEQSEPYGVYICPLCQLHQQAEAVARARHWQPDDRERHTGPIERPLFGYLRRQHQASLNTEEHRALHWQRGATPHNVAHK